ncbi:hypothetical protein, partial [Rhodopseudomonas palustris]|uniref:hypothetical protein n=1 Tax=Rhodopseudomonas palustris TaxID=1076 RepID=UPI000B1F75F5
MEVIAAVSEFTQLVSDDIGLNQMSTKTGIIPAEVSQSELKSWYPTIRAVLEELQRLASDEKSTFADFERVRNRPGTFPEVPQRYIDAVQKAYAK